MIPASPPHCHLPRCGRALFPGQLIGRRGRDVDCLCRSRLHVLHRHQNDPFYPSTIIAVSSNRIIITIILPSS